MSESERAVGSDQLSDGSQDNSSLHNDYTTEGASCQDLDQAQGAPALRPEPQAGALRYILDTIKEARALEQQETEPDPEQELIAPASLEREDSILLLTDMGNSRRFALRHGADLRYVGAWGWLIWDGRRWANDDVRAVVELAKETIHELYGKACEAEHEAQEAIAVFEVASTTGNRLEIGRAQDRLRKARGRADALMQWAYRSQEAGRLEAMLKLARSEPEIAARPGEFDQDAWLFNCQNGTINLRTGELRPHQRTDRITKIAPVTFDPDAKLDLWERFLYDTTGGDPEFQAFLQRLIGYCLTGEVVQEVMCLAIGPTASGKTTFGEAVKAALGNYAQTAASETFLVRPASGAARNDIAALAGSRFVFASEAEKGQRLAEAMIKQLTGGDTKNARFLYREGFDFRPTFKLWLACNHAPIVSHDDDAIWRRIVRLPFIHTVPPEKRDPSLKARLRDPALGGPAILAWAIRGCLDWQKLGLGTPPAVKAATDEYRQSQDTLAPFFEQCCVLGPDYQVAAGDLREAYEQWGKEGGLKRLVVGQDWGNSLRAKGCSVGSARIGGKPTRVWRGIDLVGQA